MTPDPFGRAIRDHHRGERTDPLIDRDGAATREHPIERFYFRDVGASDPALEWIESWLDGPLLEMGAGVGRHALYFQERFGTVATEVSDRLVAVMRDRGVDDARRADMFALPEAFDPDRFRSAFATGTQVCLAGSLGGLEAFLGDLDAVTTADATAVLDGYDPAHERAPELLGYRPDPAPGLASRVYHEEYGGEVGPTLLFRLFGPDRLREAAVGTGWRVAAVREGDPDRSHYRVALTKG